MAAPITHKLVSLAEAADALAVSTKTVRRYIAAGQLDAVRLGRKTLDQGRLSRAVHRRPAGGRVEGLKTVLAAPLG